MRTVLPAILLLPLLLAAGCDRPADPVDDEPIAQPVLPDGAPAPSGNGLTDPATAPPASTETDRDPAAPLARAVLHPTAGHSAGGELLLIGQADAVRISGQVHGLQPDAEHGFHIHEIGDCSAADASSAGGHFAIGDQPHGRPGEPPHHAGDMPNLRSDGDGRATVDLQLQWVELGTGAAADVVGRAIVVHQQADDYQSQPAGDSGPRIACGVIELAAE
jgi:superoxide dismutase, Cu-Zn family